MHTPRGRATRIALKVAIAALLLGVGAYGGAVLATPGSGVTSKLLGQGTLQPVVAKAETGNWELELETKGLSNLSVTENRVAPGGHFGWHSHPGPSLVIVVSGTSTFYRADDPTCTGKVHPAGTAYVDPGGDTHIARNEGDVELVVLVTRLIPSGAAPRIDQPASPHCDF